MKRIFNFLIILSFFYSHSQNLLDTSTWTVGSGSVSGYIANGKDLENHREVGTDPYGNQSILWKTTPDGDTSSPANGGWSTNTISADHTKTYRFTVWMKKTNSFDGYNVLRAYIYDASSNGTALNLNGSPVSNPIIEYRAGPELNKWYLYVGFIHKSSYTGTTAIGGVYDQTNGLKIMSSTDLKFAASSTSFKHNPYLYGGDNPMDALYFWGPTIYEVNGQEPSISEMLNPSSSSDTQAPTPPTLSSTSQTDTTVDLNWADATDNTAVTGYKIFKDGVLEATLGNITLYQVTGLSAGTSYVFTSKALDAAGNESSASNTVSVTTNSSGGSSSGSTVWNEANSVASYSGTVAVGTNTVPNGYKMAIDGNLITEEVKVQLRGNWPDYVFTKEYKLPTLAEVKKHINAKGHLINIPSAKEVEANGIELGEMNKLLLEKIEELTLYILEQNKNQKQLEKRIQILENNN